MSNPYIYRGPLHESEHFYGREDELIEITAFLRGNQSISIVGPRKIGKTSLLFHLVRNKARTKYNIPNDEYLIAYLDCEVLGDLTHEEIYGEFCSEIEATLEMSQVPVDESLTNAINTPGRIPFERAIRKLNQNGQRVVLIMDEFERLSTNPNLNVNFFNALRSAAGRYQLAFITASANPLIQLTYTGKSQEILSSPFFNIFAQMFLGLFPKEEALTAIQAPAEKASKPFSDKQLEKIYKLVGGHPLGIQIACFHSFEKDADTAERKALDELNPHYQYYWNSLNKAEQSTLLQIGELAARAASDTTLRGILRDLTQKCMIIWDNKTYGYPSSGLEQFIARQGAENSSGFIRRFRDSLLGVNIGPYEIQEPIAQGGMAEVYKGRHERLDRTVAIKILSSSLASDDDFRARFEREAQAIAGLRHPNIVQVYDFGDLENMYYMVMEFIAGNSLARLIKERAPFSVENATPILSDIASALDYAHSKKIVHRDVKPSNILMHDASGDGKIPRAILTDFGIAKIRGGSSQQTKTGILMGTLDYIAPEQIKSSGEVDHRADIYSVGVLTYQLLTGELPFTADNPGALMMCHLHETPPDPREKSPALGEPIAKMILAALEKSPDNRPANLATFVIPFLQ